MNDAAERPFGTMKVTCLAVDVVRLRPAQALTARDGRVEVRRVDAARSTEEQGVHRVHEEAVVPESSSLIRFLPLDVPRSRIAMKTRRLRESKRETAERIALLGSAHRRLEAADDQQRLD